MMELLPVAIGVGLVVSLLLSETLGVASAGMVVPGYVALYLSSPRSLACTALACGLSYAALRLSGRFVILYGRRRTALAILFGYLAGALVSHVMVAPWGYGDPTAGVIGYIIPGLVAIWMDRQGVLSTFGALTLCSVLVRLVLLVFVGAELPTPENFR
jgi:poly-gamma-glutamate biosynthesis protein PgsC/CapC